MWPSVQTEKIEHEKSGEGRRDIDLLLGRLLLGFGAPEGALAVELHVPEAEPRTVRWAITTERVVYQ